MKIAIDIDSTIIESIQMLVKIYNYHNPNNKLVYYKKHDWNLTQIVGDKEGLKELFKYFDYEGFYNREFLCFTYGAWSVINKLSKTHEIIFCSKHQASRKPITTKFINEYFPNCGLVFVDNFEDKCSIQCDMIIDDKIECLENSVADYKVCFGNYQWNKDWNGVRFTNWVDLEDCITILNIIDDKEEL